MCVGPKDAHPTTPPATHLSKILRTYLFFPFLCVLYFEVLHCTSKYCFVPSIVLYFEELHCIVLYCTSKHCIVLFCIVLYFEVLHCIVLYFIVLYCIVLRSIAIALYFSVLYCTSKHCTVLSCIVLYFVLRTSYWIGWSVRRLPLLSPHGQSSPQT